MAGGLEDVTPHVEIEGVDEAVSQLEKLGAAGAEAFAHIIESATHGDLTGIVTHMFGELAGTLAEVTKSVFEFVDAQASAAETLSNLAEATGMTVPEIEGLKDAFASVGISTNGFERAIGRLAITIGSEWAGIQQSVRTSADSQEQSMLSLQDAAEKVRRSYQNLEEVSTHAAQTAAHDALGIRETQMNLEKALEKQKEDKPGYVAPADDAQRKQRQKEAEDQLAVDRAQQAVRDAQNKQIEDSIKAQNQMRDAVEGVRKAKLAESEAGEKAHELDLKDIPRIAKEVENVAAGYKTWDQVMNHAEISAQSLTKAVILAASGGGSEPPKAMDVFKEMSKLFANMGDDADSMNKKLEIVQKTMGAGFRAGQASAAQMLAVLERGPEALEKFNKEAEKFSQSGIGMSKGDVDSLKEFNSAWAQLDGILDQVKGHLAALAAAAITPILNAMKESLEDNDGVLHKVAEGLGDFITGLVAVGKAIGTLIEWISQAISAVLKFVGIDAAPLSAWLIVIGAIAIAIGGIPAAIAIAITAIGAIINKFKSWDDIKAMLGDFAIWFESTWVGKIIAGIAKVIGGIANLGAKIASILPGYGGGAASGSTASAGTNAGGGEGGAQETKDAANQTKVAAQDTQHAADTMGTAGQKHDAAADKLSVGGDKINQSADALTQAGQALSVAATAIQQAASSKGSPEGRAGGGMIRGPGGPTSDTAGVFALSDGEFVVRAAAVQHYGSTLFEGLNSLAVGGFAMGGLVGGARPATSPGAGSSAPSSILNLTIDGNHFNGLRAPASVAGQLKAYAVTRQASSAQRRPSWAR